MTTPDRLNKAQQRARDLDHPLILCVAGPGSGKTTVLASRIQRLVDDGTSPVQIAAFTYTNAAARNLEERVGLIEFLPPLGVENESDNWRRGTLGFAGTLHGFCLRLLRLHGEAFGYGPRTAVVDADASAELLATKAKQMKVKDPLARVVEINKGGRPKGPAFTPAELAVLAYRDELAETGLVDFDMILTETLRLLDLGAFTAALLREFNHLLVDEVQDMAAVDWAIVRALPIPNKFLVGDPDQAIFSWRDGGNGVAEMLRASGDANVEFTTLQENYRCGVQICDAANRLIRRNTNRIDKGTYSVDLAPAKVIRFGQTQSDGEEIAQVGGFILELLRRGAAPASIAVLARTNKIADGFRNALKVAGVAVVEPPKTDLPPDWALARALVEAIAQPSNDTLVFFYIVAQEVRRGLKPAEARAKAQGLRHEAAMAGRTLNSIWFGMPEILDAASIFNVVGQYADGEDLSRESRMVLVDMMRALPAGATLSDLALEVARKEVATPEAAPAAGLTCTTIHAAKGREWDVVFLVGFEDEVIPGRRKDVDVEEERRLAFVGITRARSEVYVSGAALRASSWGRKLPEPRTPSRFVAEIFGGEDAP